MWKLAVVVVALAVAIVNPWFLWRWGNPSFEFGEAEMRAAVEGTWTIVRPDVSGCARLLTVHIEQERESVRSSRSDVGLVPSAEACGERSFVKSGEACVDRTEMPLHVVALDGSTAQLDGRLTVYGTRFAQAELLLWIDDDAIKATVSPRGDVTADGDVIFARRSR